MTGAPAVGIDVLELGELDRLCERPWFLRHCFAAEELARAERLGPGRRREYLAGRFAAKEAVLKMLGTGLLRGIAPREIAVGQDRAGRPLLHLHGRAAARAADLGLRATAVSIAHKRRTVAAVAVGRLDPRPRDPSPPRPAPLRPPPHPPEGAPHGPTARHPAARGAARRPVRAGRSRGRHAARRPAAAASGSGGRPLRRRPGPRRPSAGAVRRPHHRDHRPHRR
ncbi:holo-ACP synthase [Kitasatospora sp. NPDC002551]|uniref:holo-ACP synthase n=1 Tax=Kitasatospora sp. NPDC002551 TaxID=3154539 RepID=UPI00332CBF4A